jgi:hypothetical protein
VFEPAVARAVLLVLASAPTIAFVLNWGAKLLVAAHGLRQRDVGLYLWLPPLAFDAGAVGFGGMGTLRRRRRGGALASERLLVGAATALACSIAALAITTSPWATTAVLALALAGGGGLFALLTADLLERVDPSRVATAGGITAAAQSLAYIIANPIVGAVVGRTGSYAGVALGLGLITLPGALAWILWEPSVMAGDRAGA